MPTTTIEITQVQKETLDELKDHEAEPYKSVLGRLIEGYRNGQADPMEGYSNVDQLADEIVGRIDMAADPGAPVTDGDVEELAERVRELQAMVERAPERTADELEARRR